MMLQFVGFPLALRKRQPLSHFTVKGKPSGQNIICDSLAKVYFFFLIYLFAYFFLLFSQCLERKVPVVALTCFTR